MSNIVFTPASLIDLLSQIDELSDYDTIGVTETLDGKFQLNIGESTYIVEDPNITTVEVEEEVVDAVEDANEEAYDNLGEYEIEEAEPVESGILKEIAKTLLVGGMVRLAGKVMK